MNIISITNATDIPVIETDVPHGFFTSQLVLIANVIRINGDVSDLLNGFHNITGVPSSTTFNISGIYHGTFSGGTVVPLTSCISTITFTNTASFTISHTLQAYNVFSPSNVSLPTTVLNVNPLNSLSLSGNLISNLSLGASNTLVFSFDVSIVGIERIDGDGYLVIINPEESSLDSIVFNFHYHSIPESLKNQVTLVLNNTWYWTNFNIIDEHTLELLGPFPEDLAFDTVDIIYYPPHPDYTTTVDPLDTYIDAADGADNDYISPIILPTVKKLEFEISLSGYDPIPYEVEGKFNYEISDGTNFERGVGEVVDGAIVRSEVYDSSEVQNTNIDFDPGVKSISITPFFVSVDVPLSSSGVSIFLNSTGSLSFIDIPGPPLLPNGRMTAEAAVEWARVYENLLTGENFLIIRNSDGVRQLVIAQGHTPEQLFILRTQPGTTIITSAQAQRLVQEVTATHDVPQHLRVLGSTSTLPALAARAGAGARLIRTGVRLAGVFAAAATQTGFIALDFINAIPLNYRYRQGRLQVINKISITDADRYGMNTSIFYTPINSEEPGLSQITLAHGGSTNEPRYVPYRFVMSNGRVPTLNLQSPIPFSFDATKLAPQAELVDGLPFDIFITSPLIEPLLLDRNQYIQSNEPGQSIRTSFAELNSLSHRANEGPEPLTINQLPRLFRLNWASPVGRRSNGIGHRLIFNSACGLALYTRLTTENYITDGLPGFMTVAAESKYWKYLYLGTAVAMGGVIICCPGTRLLTNYTNALPYDDFKVENTPSWPIHRFARSNSTYPLKPDSSRWRHAYIEPREAIDEMPSMRPVNGRCSIGLCGPIGIRIVNEQYNVNGRVVDELRFPLNEAFPCSGSFGSPSCVTNESVMNEIHMPGNTPLRPGFNITEVLATIRPGFDPWEYNYCFVGTQHHFYFDVGIGYNSTSNPETDRFTDQSIRDGTNPDVNLRRSHRDYDQAVRGFGMQGSC